MTHQLTVTHRGANPAARVHPPIEWETGNPRFNGKNASKINAIAADTSRQRYGRAGTMSTWPERALNVRKFIILTGFRVAKHLRLGECPAALNPPPKFKDFA